jgi:hypothetical protein
MKSKIVWILTFAVLGVLAAGAGADQTKSYLITFRNDVKAGTATLDAGEYKLVVDAPKVRFTEVQSGKSVEVDATINTTETKFDNTAIVSQQVDGKTQITEIQLGGSKTKITFP